jgi:hypothetical protein
LFYAGAQEKRQIQISQKLVIEVTLVGMSSPTTAIQVIGIARGINSYSFPGKAPTRSREG